MKTEYHPSYPRLFGSKIDGSFFKTVEQARAHDTSLAFSILHETRLDRLHAAFERRDDELAKALKFLMDETDLMPDFEAEITV